MVQSDYKLYEDKWNTNTLYQSWFKSTCLENFNRTFLFETPLQNKQKLLTVLVEARVQHASLKTDSAPLLKTTRLFPRVQQPKQYVLPEMATGPRLHRIKLVLELVENYDTKATEIV